MNKQEKNIITSYKKNQGIYMQLEKTATDVINKTIENNNYFVMDVASRVKTIESLTDKIKRKNGKYSDITDITDLVGIRIICYFADTVDAIADKLREVFDVDEENSIDKRSAMQATQFGYLSLHCICNLKPSDDIPDILCRMPFEIQIRTVLQHAWAEIEHDLGYKSDFGVPRPIRRDFSRVASLLEIADDEFIQIRRRAISYNESIKEKIATDNSSDIPLDKISLKYYLQINKDINELYDKVLNTLGVSLEILDHFTYISLFEWLRVDTIGELADLFIASQDYVYDEIKELAELYEIDVLSTGIILKFMCEYALIHGDFSKARITRFYKLTTKDPKKIEKSVDRILEKRAIHS